MAQPGASTKNLVLLVEHVQTRACNIGPNMAVDLLSGTRKLVADVNPSGSNYDCILIIERVIGK